ncbi:hypothetical protein ABEV00_03865 [Paenibacillus thiaminolyticus]|uniref:hypothetical protein n=1 Tax=Paenibacillus thiaminolyticus TaxID=49283 RepID=UPI003D2AE7A9
MPRYESVRERILNNLSLYPFELCTEEEIVKERIEGVPEDYLDFLKGVGTAGRLSKYGMMTTCRFITARNKALRNSCGGSSSRTNKRKLPGSTPKSLASKRIVLQMQWSACFIYGKTDHTE